MSRICPTLAVMERSYVDFDPMNPEHLKAFKMLCIGETPTTPIKQHATLRFNIEHPFTDVRTMMFHRVGEAHVQCLSTN